MWQVAAGLVGGACVALVLPATVPLAAAFVAGACSVAPARGCDAPGSPRPRWLAAGRLAVTRTTRRPARPGTRRQLGFDSRHRRLGAPGHAAGTEVSRSSAGHGARRDSLPRLLELTWYDAPTRVLAGEDVELEVKLRRPRGFSNPGGHDNEARMLRDGVGASGYVRSGKRLGRRPGRDLDVSGADGPRQGRGGHSRGTGPTRIGRHRGGTRGRPAGCRQS